MTTRVLPPLRLGPLTVDVPVVLAPMAGVTSAPFRRLCREAGAGLAIAEMVTSRALVEHNPEAWHMASFEPDECPRSVQLYGVDPVTVGAAVRALVTADGVDHIDLNFGCPAPKVTRRGGGSALPWKTELYRAIVRAAVREATPSGVPVTVKLRTGIDDEHVTFLDAGRIARDEGVAAVILHARTTAQYYSGKADWSAIARLKQALPDLPVLGNGDVFSAEDGLAMVAQTGCDGVVVGRGCQGRPWVFADLAAAFTGSDERVRPSLGDVAGVVRRHAGLLARYFADERQACRDLRKHMAWYFRGYAVGGDLRTRLAMVSCLVELDGLLAELDPDQPYPGAAAEGPRGRAGTPKTPHVPYGWLVDRELSDELRAQVADAELAVSGG